MKVIKSSFEELFNTNPQKHIENIARTCYKSNNLITDDSHKQFIKNIYNRKHWTMLEHYIFIYEIKWSNDNCDYPLFFEELQKAKFINESLINISSTTDDDNNERYTISFNARSLLDMLEYYTKNISGMMTNAIIELIEQVVFDYDCDEMFGNRFKKVNHSNKFVKIDDITKLTPEEQWIHGWKTIKFICDRGVSHEIVRHRIASFAQESTRYCNYSKDKFDNEIVVIKPFFYISESSTDNSIDYNTNEYDIWEKAMKHCEDSYFKLLNEGSTPQEARTVLPNSLKTEVIMTARNDEWKHFFELRCDKAAHPQMRELALPLYDYFKSNNVLFNDYIVKFEK